MSRNIPIERINSPIFLRSHYERVLFDLVRTSGSLSRADLVRASSLTFPTVSRIVDGLVRGGFVSETRQRRGGMGKPPTELAVNETRAFSIGVACADDCLRTVLIDVAGKVADRWQETLPRLDAETLQRAVAKAVEQLGAHEKVSGRSLAGVGVALPASVSEGIQESSLLADAPEGPLASRLSRQLGCPVLVDTAATAGAVGERWLGSGRSLDNFYYLAMGDEVGGTMMVHGRPYSGARGNAGELGHAAAVWQSDAPELSTAVSQLFEQLRSANHAVDAGTLAQLLDDEDELLFTWVSETAQQLVPLLMAVEYLLDPQAFVLGGSLPSPLANTLLERLVTLTRELRSPAKPHAPEFLRGASGDDALAVGAATLPLYQSLSPDVMPGRFSKGLVPSASQ